jgi:hypothetical protein
MTRRWHIIDADGWRRIDVAEKGASEGEKRWNVRSGFRADSPQSAVWPAFAQIAARAPLDEVRRALRELADQLGCTCRDVTNAPETWDEALLISLVGERSPGPNPALTLLAEPRAEFDERLLNPEIADSFFENLRADGAFYGYEPHAGTLMLSVYRAGAIQFSWSDSVEPGPSHALTFHADGRATAEDPRPFALGRLGHAPDAPMLDRHAFLEREVAALGLREISPRFDDLPIAAALRIEARTSRHLG